MSPFSSNLPGVLQDAGLVLGLVVSLLIGSYLIRDGFLARLGQYVLVGAGLGYLAVIVWRNVLWPRLFAPLTADPMSWQSASDAGLLNLWLPLFLGVLMWGGGLELLRRPPERLGVRSLVRLLAAVPAAILGGVVLGVAVSGAVQGTLWPQLGAALQSVTAGARGEGPGASNGSYWPLTPESWALTLRFLTLLITGGVLIHLQVGSFALPHGERKNNDPRRTPRKHEVCAERTPSSATWRSANRQKRRREGGQRQTAGAIETGPSSSGASSSEGSGAADDGRHRLYRKPLQTLLRVWEGIGRRALWLAAGVIFARLVAARFSLALSRLDYFLFEVPRSDLWQLLWATLLGAGS